MAPRVWIVALALLLAVAVPAIAVNFDVGGNGGWTDTTDYSTWVSGKTFSGGDTLTFSYGPSHSVVRMGSKDDYDNCNFANAVTTENSSPTKVTLDKAGTTYYFVCGTAGHCANGMKLTVTTAAGGGGSTPSTPTAPATPSTPTTPSTPSATPSTPSTTPAKPSAAPATVTGAAAAVAGIMGLAVAVLA